MRWGRWWQRVWWEGLIRIQRNVGRQSTVREQCLYFVTSEKLVFNQFHFFIISEDPDVKMRKQEAPNLLKENILAKETMKG
jgi:hypothetical protein